MAHDGIYLFDSEYAYDAAPGDFEPAITFEFDQIRTLERLYFMKRYGRGFNLNQAFIEVSLDGNKFHIFNQINPKPVTQIFEVTSTDGPVKMKFVRIIRNQQWLDIAEVAFIGY